MTSYINASSPSGNGRRIVLLGTDLISGNIENVFVYPTLDVNRFRDALCQALSRWPILTGHLLFPNGNDPYLIECSDNSIPLTYTKNDQLKSWPHLPVIVDDMTILQPFIDSVQHKPEREALVRFKITHLLLSDEYVLGTSFYHMVGDANTNIRFLNDLSRIYQHLELTLPRPIFERQSLQEENLDFSLPNIIDLSENAGSRETLITCLTKEHTETEPINLSFSSSQIIQIHNLVENNAEITYHDALCAYIIYTLNKHFFAITEEPIQHIRMLVNYRGICNRLAPIGYVGNCLLTTIPADFANPLSLSDIAKTIRQSIQSIRNEDLIEKYITSANVLCRQLVKDNRINFIFGSKEFIFNSNFKYDWTDEINFGMINQCRFHTAGLFKFYFRIFRLNPTKNQDGIWMKDNGGAEIAFRIPKGEGKETFLAAYNKDIEENFRNI